jgi:proline iminopeptidase
VPELFVKSGEAVLWTIAEGQGIPVLLCNGGPGCCDYLAPVAAMIDDIAQVVRFEPRGCGRSSATPPYTVETCLQDLEAIRQHYKIDQWVIGGHSWGADLALIYALEYPAHTLGVACIAGGRMQNDREWHAEYRRRRDEEGETLPDYVYPPNMEVNEQVNQSFKQYIQRPYLWRKLSQLSIPTLFIYAEQDIRPKWAVEQVAATMKNGRFVLIPDAAHHIWFTHAGQLQTYLRNFVYPIVQPGLPEIKE